MNISDGEYLLCFRKSYTPEYWREKAEKRKKLMNRYLWDEEEGSYFDYDFIKGKQTGYISATNFYPLWAEMASEAQAENMVKVLNAASYGAGRNSLQAQNLP